MQARAIRKRVLLAPCLALLVGCGGGSGSPTGSSGGTGTDYGRGGGGGTTPNPGPSASVVITIVGEDGSMSFSPANATARVGQTVAWQNSDSITHAVVPDGAGGFGTGDIGSGGGSRAFTLTAAGSFPYHCGIHPSMVGSLSVTQ